MDPLLCAFGSPTCALPPPWGPTPPPGVNQNCTSFTCASPVYLVTSIAQIPNTNASRVVQAEVASLSAFLLNAAIVSEPGINMTGGWIASGRDMCDPDCATLFDGTPNIFANQANFTTMGNPPGPWPAGTPPPAGTVPTGSVPAACRAVIPVQSEAPTGQQSNSTSARTDPYCDPATNPSCVCQAGGGGNTASCTLANVSPPYDIDNLIDLLRPVARELTEVGGAPAPDYFAQSGTSNLNCGGSPYECQGQGVELGGFPFADYVNGPADRLITYVPGNFKCTSRCSGAGILIVDGDLELSASMSFWGIIIVRGDVSVLGGGAPATPCNIYGALITQGGINTALGGSICFQYNTCALQRQFSDTPLVRLAFREIPD